MYIVKQASPKTCKYPKENTPSLSFHQFEKLLTCHYSSFREAEPCCNRFRFVSYSG
jgi:hypothetical protein